MQNSQTALPTRENYRNLGIYLIAFASMVALAQVKLNLGFSPVPITGQTLGMIQIGRAHV